MHVTPHTMLKQVIDYKGLVPVPKVQWKIILIIYLVNSGSGILQPRLGTIKIHVISIEVNWYFLLGKGFEKWYCPDILTY